MNHKNFVTVIMAAGKGTRMGSDMAKVLHTVCGRPMIHYVITLARDLGSARVIAVIGHQKERVRKILEHEPVEFAVQEPQLGTGHAVMQAENLLKGYDGHVLVLSGDVPLLTYETMKKLIDTHFEHHAAATVLTTRLADPAGYGRVMRRANGDVSKIIEHRDATEEERKINEINSGIYMFKSNELFRALKKITAHNAQQEYYLPDVLNILIQEQQKVSVHITEDYQEISGINTAEQLKDAERILNSRLPATNIK